MVFDDSAARGSAIPTPSEGMVTYLKSDESVELFNGASFVPFGGKILQVVRATDSTQRATTSTSFVDVTGMSVTISPKKSDSNLLIVASFRGQNSGGSNSIRNAFFQLTTSANAAISGAEEGTIGGGVIALIESSLTLIGYETPGTTSAVTYKLRFRSTGETVRCQNNSQIGQIYAIEVAS